LELDTVDEKYSAPKIKVVMTISAMLFMGRASGA
jgi:hypothetical protein